MTVKDLKNIIEELPEEYELNYIDTYQLNQYGYESFNQLKKIKICDESKTIEIS